MISPGKSGKKKYLKPPPRKVSFCSSADEQQDNFELSVVDWIQIPCEEKRKHITFFLRKPADKKRETTVLLKAFIGHLNFTTTKTACNHNI